MVDVFFFCYCCLDSFEKNRKQLFGYIRLSKKIPLNRMTPVDCEDGSDKIYIYIYISVQCVQATYFRWFFVFGVSKIKQVELSSFHII